MDYCSSASSSSCSGKPTRRRGVKLSTDPQSVAARERRHRISERFKILQSLVPGGGKMDTVSLLEEAINYVKFLKSQILIHQYIMDLDHSLDDAFPDYCFFQSPLVHYHHGSSGTSEF